MDKVLGLLGLIAIVCLLFGCGRARSPVGPPAFSLPAGSLAGVVSVTYVVDGDTFDARDASGVTRRYRLIGVNTPERGEAFAGSATEFLRGALRAGRVFVMYDAERLDRYGRELVYVLVRDGRGDFMVGRERYRLVNLELVRAGWAVAMRIPPNVRFASLFRDAERAAREGGVGMFAVVGGVSWLRNLLRL